MSKRDVIDNYVFESREEYELAKTEMEIINALKSKTDMDDAKNLLKIYNKSVSERIFGTAVGYAFLEKIREKIIEDGYATPAMLSEIPVKESKKKNNDTIPRRSESERKFQRLYEGQKLLNKKLKVGLIACTLVIIGFVIINFRFEYTIFTYFTDYKQKMEDELIDKYENWQHELEEKENQLNGNK